MIEVTVPQVGESITEVQIGQWLKAEGDWIAEGEDLVEIETEKASVQIPAPVSGYVRRLTKQTEEFALVGDVIATIEPAEQPAGGGSSPAAAPAAAPSATGASAPSASPAATPASTVPSTRSASAAGGATAAAVGGFVMPAAQRLIDDLGLDASQIRGTGPGGRILKEDVQSHVAQRSQALAPPAVAATPPPAAADHSLRTISAVSDVQSLVASSPYRNEEVKPLSMLRRTIASRLVQAQQTAALLTTFNEVDMKPVMELRSRYRDAFTKKHGVKLGFMSFFAKAAVEALKRFPAVNAELRDNQIIYHHYQDIGIAIGGGKGLVVPILRNVERMSFADIERSIGEYSAAAMENRLQPQDLEGGTFTISNGGVYGSLLSTPIVNPPQSGILGLHSIQQRPVAIDGQVVIRPMMYLALTYDHRIVDGREAVTFLKTIKEVIEDPARLFLEV